jgi:hypothetical protein
MLAIIKGGHRVRGSGYKQKLYLRRMVKNQNIEDSIKKEVGINIRLQTISHQ